MDQGNQTAEQIPKVPSPDILYDCVNVELQRAIYKAKLSRRFQQVIDFRIGQIKCRGILVIHREEEYEGETTASQNMIVNDMVANNMVANQMVPNHVLANLIPNNMVSNHVLANMTPNHAVSNNTVANNVVTNHVAPNPLVANIMPNQVVANPMVPNVLQGNLRSHQREDTIENLDNAQDDSNEEQQEEGDEGGDGEEEVEDEEVEEEEPPAEVPKKKLKSCLKTHLFSAPDPFNFMRTFEYDWEGRGTRSANVDNSRSSIYAPASTSRSLTASTTTRPLPQYIQTSENGFRRILPVQAHSSHSVRDLSNSATVVHGQESPISMAQPWPLISSSSEANIADPRAQDLYAPDPQPRKIVSQSSQTKTYRPRDEHDYSKNSEPSDRRK